MKGITLPSSNLPQWASLVPEEEWKAALLSQMQERNVKISYSDPDLHSQSSTDKSTLDVSNEALRWYRLFFCTENKNIVSQVQ